MNFLGEIEKCLAMKLGICYFKQDTRLLETSNVLCFLITVIYTGVKWHVHTRRCRESETVSGGQGWPTRTMHNTV